MVIGSRFHAHNIPTTYKRIKPYRGCGFILKRIYDLSNNETLDEFPTKSDVYRGTRWEGREKEGFDSLLWSALLEDELIASEDGMTEYAANGAEFTCRSGRRYKRAKGHFENGKYVVRYQLTPAGHGILFDMMARVNKIIPNLNTVSSVAEHDAKKDWAPKPEEWREDDFLEPGETEKEWLARHTHSFEPKMGDKQMEEALKIARQEALDCAKLVGDLCDEKQKTNARLKNLCYRLGAMNDEIKALKAELLDIVDWTK